MNTENRNLQNKKREKGDNRRHNTFLCGKLFSRSEGTKTQALLVKGYGGYKQQADVNKNPAKAQEAEA